MGNITFEDITLVLSVVMLCITVFQLFAILRGTAVTAQRIGYDESEYTDPDSGSAGTSLFPIYRYSYNGVTKTYRSRFAVCILWNRARKDTTRIYISRSGKVYEKAGVIVTFAIAIILFLMG